MVKVFDYIKSLLLMATAQYTVIPILEALILILVPLLQHHLLKHRIYMKWAPCDLFITLAITIRLRFLFPKLVIIIQNELIFFSPSLYNNCCHYLPLCS